MDFRFEVLGSSLSPRKMKNNNEEKLSLPMRIIKTLRGYCCFSSVEPTYIAFCKKDDYCYHAMKSEKTEDEIRTIAFCNYNETLNPMEMTSILATLVTYARRNGQRIKPALRIYEGASAIYYMLTPDNCLKITGKSIKMAAFFKNAAFLAGHGQKQQVEPDLTVPASELLSLLRENFNVSEKHLRSFAAHLIAFFVPSLETPVLVFSGGKGTAKTTTSKQIVSLVSPTELAEVTALPRTEDALIAQIVGSYITAFDNVKFPLDERTSNLFCQVITGAAYCKRKLYTNNEKVVYNLCGKLILNGIDSISAKDDFAERCNVISLFPVQKRVGTKEINRRFNEIKPKLLGAIFATLKAVLADKEDATTKQELPRMADFAAFGMKVMRAIGENPERFLTEFNELQAVEIQDAEARLPIVKAVSALLQKEGGQAKLSPTLLARKLNDAANKHGIQLVELTPLTVTKLLKQNKQALARNSILVRIPKERKNKRFIELAWIDSIKEEIYRQVEDNDFDDL